MRESRTPGSVEGLPSQGGSLLDRIKVDHQLLRRKNEGH